MKRCLSVLLALLLLSAASLAAAYDIPQIDPAGAGLAARPITSGDDAVAYAQALWASDYLLEAADGLTWTADLRDGVYTVTARTNSNPGAEVTAIFGADGAVMQLYNSLTRFDAATCDLSAYDGTGEAELTAYLLDFLNALRPGASAGIQSIRPWPELLTYPDLTVVTFTGTRNDKDGTEIKISVEVSPRVRILDYYVFVPLAPAPNSVG